MNSYVFNPKNATTFKPPRSLALAAQHALSKEDWIILRLIRTMLRDHGYRPTTDMMKSVDYLIKKHGERRVLKAIDTLNEACKC